MTKFIAYYRVSTKKQGLGLEAQKEIIENFVSANGGVIVSEFQEKETAKGVNDSRNNECLENRPTLKSVLVECKKNGYTLIVAKVDRLTRDIETGAHIVKNYDVQFCDHPNITSLELGIFLGMAQQEREFISMRTKQGMAKSSKKAGNPNLINKTNEGIALMESNKKKLAEVLKNKADNNEANTKAFCAIRYIEGTLRFKASYLNDNGFTTPRGGEWSAKQVQRLIERYSA